MARAKLECSVTYDLITQASVVDGDTADNGYIDPLTERRRSFSNGRSRDIERNHRLARAGRFNCSLRTALAFIDQQCCAAHETCWDGGDNRMSVYCTDAYQERDVETLRGSRVISVGYCLHVSGVSDGTLDRLARVLAAHGVYFANIRSLQRRAS